MGHLHFNLKEKFLGILVILFIQKKMLDIPIKECIKIVDIKCLRFYIKANRWGIKQ